MKQDNVELRFLVDHLARALQEDIEESGGNVREFPALNLSAAQRSERSGQNPCAQTSGAWQWQDWRIRPIDGGMNGRIFRATGPADDVAVKFTVRDERDRAGREWAALTLLSETTEKLAPQPLFLDRERYPQQVTVQSWLEGKSSNAAPADDAAWDALCRHLLTIHSLPRVPDHPAIRPVVLFVSSAADALRAISSQQSQLPRAEWPQSVNELVEQALSFPWPRWPRPSLRLCRGDPNIRNFIRRPNSWLSVDWEYSGWGDPAFEIAEFLVHAAHITWPRQQKRRLVDLYCGHSGDTAIRERIPVYETLMLVWWTLRLGRLLPEARSGVDRRLAALSHSWHKERLELQKHYQQLAANALVDRHAFL